jgi:hypothetical protein
MTPELEKAVEACVRAMAAETRALNAHKRTGSRADLKRWNVAARESIVARCAAFDAMEATAEAMAREAE